LFQLHDPKGDIMIENIDNTLYIILVAELALFYIFIRLLKNHFTNGGSVIPVFVIGFLILGGFITVHCLNYFKTQNAYAEIDTKLTEKNYTFYVDGKETEPEHIDIKKYDISAYTVNDDKKEILISTQRK